MNKWLHLSPASFTINASGPLTDVILLPYDIREILDQ